MSHDRVKGSIPTLSIARAITPQGGLTHEEVMARECDGLVNIALRRTDRTVGSIIRSNVFTRINAILGILCVLVLCTGKLINALFGLLIICNSAVGIIQEWRAKRTLDRLTILGEAKTHVLRSGVVCTLPRERIVLDDLIVLGAGDQLVVDGVLVECHDMEINESMLTGESLPVAKKVGDTVLSGSFVARGTGMYQAVRIGDDAYAAKIVAEAGAFQLTDSQLQRGINKILKVVTWLLIPTGLITALTQLVRTGAPLRSSIVTMVAALVPMIPEGLVLMTSIAFAVGVIRLGRRNALVNELAAIEGLARVDVVCTDKTGTLTDACMHVDTITPVNLTRDYCAQEVYRVLSAIIAADSRPNDTLQAIARYVAETQQQEGSAETCNAQDPIAATLFDAQRKWSSVTFSDGLTWKLGAPEIVDPQGVCADAIKCAANGLRVLVLTRENIPWAMIVIQQKLRDDAEETMKYFVREHVDVKIISGDNAQSVGVIAKELGIDGAVVDARVLPDQSADQFGEIIEHAAVFGRVTPGQKRDMVVSLQEHGHAVAMTGDGVNDVLALKSARIGVAMGSGSPAARSVAQLVLLDNRFAALPYIVAEGRRVIGNIERIAHLFLTKTVYSVLLALVTALCGMVYPFQPIHVTMIGWFTIGIPAFILSLAPNHERAKEGFERRVVGLSLSSGLIVGGVTLLFWWLHYPGATQGTQSFAQASTATLVCLLVMGMCVLTLVARPLCWWKVLLIVGGVGCYIVLFAWKMTEKILLLDISNAHLLVQSLIFALCGCVLIVISSLLVKR